MPQQRILRAPPQHRATRRSSGTGRSIETRFMDFLLKIFMTKSPFDLGSLNRRPTAVTPRAVGARDGAQRAGLSARAPRLAARQIARRLPRKRLRSIRRGMAA